MTTNRPGPATIQISDDARQALIHYKYTSTISYDDMAMKMKIGTQTLERVMHNKGGARREAHMRIMRFVRRLQKKGKAV